MGEDNVEVSVALSRTGYAVLGLLGWRAMSGYDIKKMVDLGLQHFWSESYGQLYPVLKKLVGMGLVERMAGEGQGRRRRHVYRLTGEGRVILERWLGEDAGEVPVRNEWLLKFFVGARVDPGAGVRLVEAYRARERGKLLEYGRSEEVLRQALADGVVPEELVEFVGGGGAGGVRALRMFLMTLRHGVRVIEARVAWCDEVLEELGEATGEVGS